MYVYVYVRIRTYIHAYMNTQSHLVKWEPTLNHTQQGDAGGNTRTVLFAYILQVLGVLPSLPPPQKRTHAHTQTHFLSLARSLNVYMYICTYVYMYIFIYVYMYICVCIYVYMYTCMYACKQQVDSVGQRVAAK